MKKTTCAVEGCAKPRYQQSKMCVTHKMRLHRYGDVHADRARKAAEVVFHSAGYRKSVRRGHPLADGDGYVYEHRFVLYAEIGPGPHRCHWCGCEVEWRSTLEVDHLNGDRADNRLMNLVPSCHTCNTRRALGVRHRGDSQAYIQHKPA